MAIHIDDSFLPTTGTRLHVTCAGAAGAPGVVLLHGFPEPCLAWRPLFAPLVDAGFRAIAPDQRGYNTSDKPAHVRDYALEALAGDIVGLIDATGQARTRLVGHDWGGIVAWWVAQRHPERVERLVAINAPHPRVFRRFLLLHPSQLLRSWYSFAFQIPALPEAAFRWGDGWLLARTLRRTSRPGTFDDTLLDEYRQAWSQPGALRAMIHWYRAALRYPPPVSAEQRVRVPTLVVWGTRDAFLDCKLAIESAALCEHGRVEWFEGATHWVHHEEPERLGRLLVEFLRLA